VVEDEPPAADTGREWSDAELTELGNLLVRGLSTEEIARLLRRDLGEVLDKVVEIGRICRRPARTNSDQLPGDFRSRTGV